MAGISLVSSLATAATTATTKVADTLQEQTEIECDVRHGALLSFPYRKVKPEGPGRLRIAHAPCQENEVDCYTEFRPKLSKLASTGVTGTGAFMLFFCAYAVILQAFLGRRSSLRGKKLTMVLTLQENETWRTDSTYEGLESLEPQIRVPVRHEFYLPTYDGTEVAITEVSVAGKDAECKPRLEPRFQRTPFYSGAVLFDEGTVQPVSFSVRALVEKNMCLNAEVFKARWNEEPAIDWFQWHACADWDEVELMVVVPDELSIIEGPFLRSRRTFDAKEEQITNELFVSTTCWKLNLKNVQAQRIYTISWTLGDPKPRPTSVKTPRTPPALPVTT